MPRIYFNDGQEMIESDLRTISAALELELYDRLFLYLFKGQQDFMIGGSFAPTYINATTTQLAAGIGFNYDNSQTDPEPMNRPLWRSGAVNATHAAADGTHDRIDVISIGHGRNSSFKTDSRNFKDASSGSITPQSMNIETDWQAVVVVTSGTPAASPAVPSTPAGTVKIAEVLVTTTTGIGSQSAITDKRPKFRYPSSWSTVGSYSAARTGDIDDELVIMDCTAAGRTYTLPLATNCPGKKITVVKKDSSVNAVTIARSGSDLIMGATSQTLDAQYTAVTFQSDGSSNWYVVA